MYSFDSTVRYSECAEDGRLSISSLVNYLQDCSTFHSESLGLGFEHMRENHYAWFLSAWQIEIEELPAFNTDITVSTWCYGMKRLIANRNFTICDKGGRQLVRADALWFVFDTERQAPAKIPESQMAYLTGEERLDMEPTPRKIAVEGDFTQASPIEVKEHHLDTNRHVNNAQYISMAIDALRSRGQIVDARRIFVQYKRMALLGDTIVPRVHEQDGSWVVDLADEKGDTFAVVKLEVRA